MLSALCLLAAIVFAVIDWTAVSQERKLTEYVAKPATLAFLLLYAALGEHASWCLIAALTLCLLGDVYLMLNDELFPFGLLAFLLGHIAYIAEFDATGFSRTIWFIIVAGASIPLAIRIIGAISQPPLRIAVGVYMLIIAVMVSSAIASGLMIATLGALFFYASDAMIAYNRFVAPFASARVAVIVTYHIAQVLLVIGLR